MKKKEVENLVTNSLLLLTYSLTPTRKSYSPCRMLLKSGADCNLAMEDGRTPLHIAAETGPGTISGHCIYIFCLIHSLGMKYNSTGGGGDIKNVIRNILWVIIRNKKTKIFFLQFFPLHCPKNNQNFGRKHWACHGRQWMVYVWFMLQTYWTCYV